MRDLSHLTHPLFIILASIAEIRSAHLLQHITILAFVMLVTGNTTSPVHHSMATCTIKSTPKAEVCSIFFCDNAMTLISHTTLISIASFHWRVQRLSCSLYRLCPALISKVSSRFRGSHAHHMYSVQLLPLQASFMCFSSPQACLTHSVLVSSQQCLFTCSFSHFVDPIFLFFLNQHFPRLFFVFFLRPTINTSMCLTLERHGHNQKQLFFTCTTVYHALGASFSDA